MRNLAEGEGVRERFGRASWSKILGAALVAVLLGATPWAAAGGRGGLDGQGPNAVPSVAGYPWEPNNGPPELSYQIPSPFRAGEQESILILVRDPDGDRVNVSISFGDGGYDFFRLATDPTNWTVANATHTYWWARSFNVTLGVTDPNGGQANLSFALEVLPPPFRLQVDLPQYFTLGVTGFITLTVWDEDGHNVSLSVAIADGRNYTDGFRWQGWVDTEPGNASQVLVPYTPQRVGYFEGWVWAMDENPMHRAYSYFYVYVVGPPVAPVYQVIPFPTVRAEGLAIEEVVAGGLLHIVRPPYPYDNVNVDLYINGNLSSHHSNYISSYDGGYDRPLVAIGLANATGSWRVTITSDVLGVIYNATGPLLIPRATAYIGNTTVKLGEDFVVTVKVEPEGPSAILAPYTVAYTLDDRRVERTAMIFAANQSLLFLYQLAARAPIAIPQINGALGSFSTFETFGLAVGKHTISVEVIDPVVGALVLRKAFQVEVKNPFGKRIQGVKDQLAKVKSLLDSSSSKDRAEAKALLADAKAEIERLRIDIAALGPRAADVLAEVNEQAQSAGSLEASMAANEGGGGFPVPTTTIGIAMALAAAAGLGVFLGRRRRI